MVMVLSCVTSSVTSSWLKHPHRNIRSLSSRCNILHFHIQFVVKDGGQYDCTINFAFYPLKSSAVFYILIILIFQTWASNMSKASEAKIKEYGGNDFTKVTFCPDLRKFKMENLDNDIVALMSRRAYDIAASTRGVKVYLNGKRIPVSCS